jgi:hypothetical protein
MESNIFTHKSDSEEIRYYAKKLLANGQAHSVQSIKKYVSKISKKDFTEGTFAGALRDLVKKNKEYINPKRGYIQLINDERGQKTVVEEACNILDQTTKALYSEVSRLHPFEMTKDEENAVNNLKKLIHEIKRVQGEICSDQRSNT